MLAKMFKGLPTGTVPSGTVAYDISDATRPIEYVYFAGKWTRVLEDADRLIAAFKVLSPADQEKVRQALA